MPSPRLLPVGLLVLALGLVACGASEGAGAPVPTVGPSTSDPAPSTTTTVAPGSDAGPDGRVDDGREVRGDGYHGWILDPDAYAEVGWTFTDTAAGPADPRWLDEQAVAEAEAVLAADLVEREAGATEWPKEQLGEVLDRLETYERQYLGAQVDGARLVHVNALCDLDVAGADLSRTLVHVDDGGSCFWNATIDLSAGAVTRFSVNGYA